MKAQDRFRFRIWDEENRILHILLDGKKYDCDSVEIAFDGTLIGTSFTDEIEHEHSISYLGGVGCILEQCTGKKDVDGKLIYEGDIVLWRRPQTDRDVESICPIVFDDATCSFGPLLNGEACFMPRQTDLWMHVIGNIHENPELLQEK